MSTVPNLLELDHLPDGLLERPASALYQQLKGPTLIHLKGRIERPLFVSVLQHGNEVTGWEAIKKRVSLERLMTMYTLSMHKKR